ncbi:MAG: hypothetical protein JKY65_04530 [Planctomycetes bacterium]|nr:hypothetical protein [Planctomycetota bacterium]
MGELLDKGALPTPLDHEALRARAATLDARCPYCHDTIELLEESWACCALCLGRHHRECWREHGACAACGNERSLTHVPQAEVSVWRAPASFRERLMTFGAGLLFLIPFAMPPAVLAWASYSRGGLTWSDTVVKLDAALPAAERARRAYREYLISRNSGFEVTARAQLESARDTLADAVAQLEAALDEHRRADGTLPKTVRHHQQALDRLRFYLGNTERSLKARRDADAVEKRLSRGSASPLEGPGG